MEFRVLGPLAVWAGNGEIRIGAAKQRALLALLLLRRGQLVPTGVLVEELWGGQPPATAVKTVQVYVAELRKLLGKGLIVTRPGGYLLDTDPTTIDAVCFDGLIAQGRELIAAGETAAARERLSEALALWRGPPLAEFQDDAFARDEIRRLEELRLLAQELLLETEIALGRHAEAVPELETLIREHPLRENLRRLLMLALYRSGRQADALAVYRDTRATLLDQLGLDPSESLQALETAILNHDPALEPTALVAEHPDAVRRTNLPVPATGFIGREHELNELGSLLDEGVRLLTLTGPGGTGKTRLALQAVADAAESFPDGVWWVPLASLRDPGLVLSAVAQALGVPEQPGRRLEETLIDVLSAVRAVVLLDNLEQLLPGAAGPVAALRDAGGATVVVTSRERLQLSGERVYPVAPLATPEAVELFCARTAALGIDAGDLDAVVELCARLDNLPLAIELAAATTVMLPAGEILSRLGGSLDRLRGGRDADPRQQTLRAAIAWSHDLLNEQEQELFARLAVFSGGGTLDAVATVCDADLDVLSSLLDKSLVRRTDDRVWMLETIREFASEQLEAQPDADELRDRHARFYRSFAEAWDRELRGAGQAAALKRFAAERDNLRVALERILDSDPQAAVRLVSSLWAFWFMRGHFMEGRETLRAALEREGPEPSEARASALVGAALFALDQGDEPRSLSLLNEGLACARAVGSIGVQINALTLLPGVHELGREERIRHGEAAIALARGHGDPWLLGLATGNHGSLLAELGETEKAVELTEEAYRLCRGIGDVSLTVLWLSNLSQRALETGDTLEARRRLNEALELARQIDDGRGIGLATLNLGWVELLETELERACSCFEEAATIGRRLGIRVLGAEAIWGLAEVAAAEDRPHDAARLAGAASALMGLEAYDPTAFRVTRHLETARAALGESPWQNAWNDGTGLDLEAALRLSPVNSGWGAEIDGS